MENVQERKLGAGIITLSVLHLIGNVIGIISSIVVIVMNDKIVDTMSSLGVDPSIYEPSKLVVSLILSVLLAASVILILTKKSLGVYGYFIVTVLSIINSLMTAGFSFLTLVLSLILPVLMAFFIYKRKYVFGFKSKDEDLTA